MNIIILGAAGFIGTNLTARLAADPGNRIVAVDEEPGYFHGDVDFPNVEKKAVKFDRHTDFQSLLAGQEQVYHLVSTNNPASSNRDVEHEITDNIEISVRILEACVSNRIRKIIFLSSGGTVYGKGTAFPIREDAAANPITTYGIQKLTVEKLVYLYHYIHGLDYAVIRLSNPYGPYQRPDGRLGVVTTFIYKALRGETLMVYGDGSIIRDYIYIADAVTGIIRIAQGSREDKVFNLGSGKGVSIRELISVIETVAGVPVAVAYLEKRSVDVPVSYLDISRYERNFGQLSLKPLEEGIRLTINYFEKEGYIKHIKQDVSTDLCQKENRKHAKGISHNSCI